MAAYLKKPFTYNPLIARKPLIRVMVASLNIIQDRITRSRLAGEPPDISINPRVGRFGLLQFHRAAEIIEEGKRAVDAIAGDLADTVDTIAGTLR